MRIFTSWSGERSKAAALGLKSLLQDLFEDAVQVFVSDHISPGEAWAKRLGTELDVIITGVADYGFFGQAVDMPVEGLVHISTLASDYYYYEEATHSLIGRRTNRRYRLGDKVRVTVVRVDLQRRQLDFRVAK